MGAGPSTTLSAGTNLVINAAVTSTGSGGDLNLDADVNDLETGTVVFGAPTGELHSLPISIAADLVRLAGFDVLELGAPPARDREPRFLELLSRALLLGG